MTLNEFVKRFPVTHLRLCAFAGISHTTENKIRLGNSNIKPYRKRAAILRIQQSIRKFGEEISVMPFDMDLISNALQQGPISPIKLSLLMGQPKKYVQDVLENGTDEQKTEVYKQLVAIGKAMIYIEFEEYREYDELASLIIGMKKK